MKLISLWAFCLIFLHSEKLFAMVVIDPPPKIISDVSVIENWCNQYCVDDNEYYTIDKFQFKSFDIIHAGTLHVSDMLFSYDVLYIRNGENYILFKDYGYSNGLSRKCIIYKDEIIMYNFGDDQILFNELDRIDLKSILKSAQQGDAPEPASPAR
jgi:hypothetical protein